MVLLFLMYQSFPIAREISLHRLFGILELAFWHYMNVLYIQFSHEP